MFTMFGSCKLAIAMLFDVFSTWPYYITRPNT